MTEEAPPTLVNVDDSSASLYLRSRILRQAGYRVFDASNGRDGLDLVRTHKPHVALLDVNMPDITGLEVCRILKEDPRTASTLVLQISASAVTDLDRISGLRQGADAYLVEPLDPGVLVATVRALVRLRETEVQLTRANRELQRSNEDLARFAYAASHDLQEPIRTVIMYSQLLRNRFRDDLPADAHKYIDFTVQAAGIMRQLVHDLLAYSRVGATSEQQPVNLNEVLDEARNALKITISESRASIESDPLPVVMADPHEMLQVMMNLIGNSLKYAGDRPPVVRIRSEKRHDNCHISFQDNGMGFDSKYADYIFEAFKRLDRGDVPGSGVGLAICRRVIEKHGGRIWAEGQPGLGATFHFTLPLEIPRSSQAQV